GELTRAGRTLPASPADPASGRATAPRQAGTLDQTTNFLPSAAHLTAQQNAPGRDIEAAGQPTPTPFPAGATTPPLERRDTASPGPAHSQERAAPQWTMPQPAADPPTIPARPDAAPAAPAFFGRYQVRRALGAGGFGTVYLGHDTQLDRPVAIKVLRTGPGLPQAEAERFLQEARRLARLRHPGIVAVHDVGVQEG